MKGLSVRSFLIGAVLASGLTLGGMVIASGDTGTGGAMSMMSQMHSMMSKCSTMMDGTGEQTPQQSKP
ncbi:hypothetical protein MA04_02369 [Alcanivorax balearicus MACL04]|uniref:Uncharacterized protein n=1 Tax=Alloalcanivorax balearicus MACL04 TaxID=1177182 RepID=A0ABT2R011_9GAMM|nr:hypothetical protein [Alloalcanivorax balearicus]MCU5783069.1 hypothetical protein [Alloalcanivorax balearicus MACL04]